MTREDALKKLRELRDNTDQEMAHVYADDVLCDLLKSLGYEDIVDEYENIDKWYA